MRIAQLRVCMGEHVETVNECSDEDPDIAELLRMATASSAVITVEVPQSPEAASVLGRLIFGRPKSVRNEAASLFDLIPDLSLSIDNLELRTALQTALSHRGISYVWQVAQKSKSDLWKMKGIGRRSVDDCEELLKSKGLSFGMNLDSVMEHLPQPPSA